MNAATKEAVYSTMKQIESEKPNPEKPAKIINQINDWRYGEISTLALRQLQIYIEPFTYKDVVDGTLEIFRDTGNVSIGYVADNYDLVYESGGESTKRWLDRVDQRLQDIMYRHSDDYPLIITDKLILSSGNIIDGNHRAIAAVIKANNLGIDFNVRAYLGSPSYPLWLYKNLQILKAGAHRSYSDLVPIALRRIQNSFYKVDLEM